MARTVSGSTLLGGSALALLAAGSYLGLFVAPPERYMGEVQRIMYVHVPTAWVCLLCFTFAAAIAVASLVGRWQRWDSLLVAGVEAGVVLNVLLLLQGMIWARATWGIWWDWDVRLTTSLVMLFLFLGVLALRSFVTEPAQRATWTAVTAILAFVDVPLVYFCVRWWRSLHQIQSSPETVDAAMVLPLRLNALGVLLLAAWFIHRRSRIERARAAAEDIAEPERLARLEVHHA